MRYRTFKGCLISFLLIPQLAVFALETDHDAPANGPAPLQRPSGEAGAVSVDQLKKNVREIQNAGTPNWWKSVNALLDQTTSADAAAFAKEIAEGRRQNLFNFAVQARAMDTAALKEATRKTGAPEAREAAVNEMERRLQDPLTKFIAEHYSLRPELAMKYAAELKKAKGDDAKTAKLLARLLGTLNRAQREALLKAASDSAKNPGIDSEILGKIAQAVTVSLGGDPNTAFKQAFKQEWGATTERNRQFDQLLSNALSGDKASRDELVKRFGKDAVLDYVSAQLRNGNDGRAVELAKAIARKDADGNLFLDLNPDNAALATDTKGQSLFLGNEKSNESIRAALSAFDNSNAKDHGDVTSFDPGTKGRLQQFSLGDSAPAGGRRVFASAGADGRPALSEVPAGQALPTNVASEKIITTRPLPEPKPLETPKPPTTTPPPSNTSGKLSDADAKALLNNKCQRCHGDGGTVTDAFHYTDADFNNKAKLKKMAAAMQKSGTRRMPKNDPGFGDTAEGKKLLQWLADKTK